MYRPIMSFRTLLLPLACLLFTACSDNQAPAVEASTASSSTADAAKIIELKAQLARLQLEAGRIRDTNAIKRLQRAYGYYMEEGLWDEVVSLFTDNATVEYARDGVYRGKARIRDYLYALNDGQQGLHEGQLNETLQLMPVVTLAEDGLSAKARWRNIMLLGKLGSEANWAEGPYENEYVKENGIWKFSKLRWYQSILVPYKGGWGHSEDVNKGIWVSDKLPPDQSPTSNDGSWPTTFLPPFSFTNPVGKYTPTQTAAETAAERGQQ